MRLLIHQPACPCPPGENVPGRLVVLNLMRYLKRSNLLCEHRSTGNYCHMMHDTTTSSQMYVGF